MLPKFSQFSSKKFMVCTIHKAVVIEKGHALNDSSGVTSSRGTIEIFTRLLFVRNRTLSMLCFVVKTTQTDKNMKEIRRKKATSRRRFFSSSIRLSSSLPELFLTDSYGFPQLFLSNNSTRFLEIFAFIL